MKALKDLHIAVDGVREPRKADRETQGRKGVWMAGQAARFLAHHAEHRLYAGWVLAIVAGLRRGELQHVMKDRLGHSSRRTTDEVYTHVLDHSARKAAELMETAIFGPTRQAADSRTNPTRRLAAARRRIRRAT